MSARRCLRLTTFLALAGALAVPRPAAAQQPGDFRAMPLADVTRWLEQNLPAAAQLRYVRIDDDDEGARRVDASVKVVGVRFTGCTMDFRERLAIDNKPVEVRRYSLNLGGLTRDVVATEITAAEGQLSPSRWWTVLIHDANGRGALRATGEEGTPSPGRVQLATIQIPDESMAHRVAGALSAAVTGCKRRS